MTDAPSATENTPATSARTAVRVGGIDYLNALPLTEYLSIDGEPRLEIERLVPSRLAAGLRAGELDLALVPVVEYLEREEYRVLPGMCISSYGAVESIRLYCRCEPGQVRRVGLDACSRTSAMLTKLLFRRRWNVEPEFESVEPARLEAALEEPTTGPLDAVLLIGDVALRRPRVDGWRVLDLGNEWTRWTGLPFVYAFWVWRGHEPLPAGLLERFQQAKRLGISRIDDIVRRWPRPAALEECRCREYLVRVIQYDLGTAQEEGLRRFFALLREEDLGAGVRQDLRYV